MQFSSFLSGLPCVSLRELDCFSWEFRRDPDLSGLSWADGKMARLFLVVVLLLVV